ncbi:MAG: hypothetical protein ACRD2I_00805 [Vicinamibacterales bacterium]
MTQRKSRATRRVLIAVDGVDPAAILTEARAAAGASATAGISRWDASGVFQELAVAGKAAGAPSARTLLLLYAADLAFRLRWQIRPALAEGRTVVAAPYVETAVAFGRAAGLDPAWLTNLFRFAPRPSRRRFVHTSARRAATVKEGFVGFSCNRLAGAGAKSERHRMVEQTAAQLRRRDRSDLHTAVARSL